MLECRVRAFQPDAAVLERSLEEFSRVLNDPHDAGKSGLQFGRVRVFAQPTSGDFEDVGHLFDTDGEDAGEPQGVVASAVQVVCVEDGVLEQWGALGQDRHCLTVSFGFFMAYGGFFMPDCVVGFVAALGFYPDTWWASHADGWPSIIGFHGGETVL